MVGLSCVLCLTEYAGSYVDARPAILTHLAAYSGHLRTIVR
jgi:hypothetical protein